MSIKLRFLAACILFTASGFPQRAAAQEDVSTAYVQKFYTNQAFVLRFKAALDTLTAQDNARYSISGRLIVKDALVQGPYGRTLVLITDSVRADTAYQVSIHGIRYHGVTDDSITGTINDIKVERFNWWNIPVDTIENITHSSFWSQVHDKLVGFSIYLPPGYEEVDSMPVEYFLGGLGNDETLMYPKISKYFQPAVESAEIPLYIVVFPNPMKESWYLDNQNYLVETMITRELIPHIDLVYKSMKSVKGRWISGFSMGGFGSLNLGMRHTDLFSSVVSYGIARQPDVDDPGDVKENLQIRMICGEKDFYYPMQFTKSYKMLQSLGIPVDYQTIPNAEHSIGQMYVEVGIKGIKFHWRTLGGFNEKPMVMAGEDIITGNREPAMIHLNGRIRDDSYPGTSLVHYWEKAGGTGGVEFDDSGSLDTYAYLNDTGDYRIVLKASDGEHAVSDTLNVYVSPEKINSAPVLDPGRDRYLVGPDWSHKLSGKVTDDGLPEGESLTTWWSLTDGPAAIALSDSLDPAATATFTRSGEYILSLKSTDTDLQTERDLHITVVEASEKIPALRWRFNEGMGDTLYNCSGEPGKGLLILNPAREPGGREGSCIRFDGIENYARLMNTASLDLFRDPFTERTISIWFRTDNNRFGTHMIYDEGNLQNGISISKWGGKLYVTASNTERFQMEGLFIYYEGWQHVALRFDRGDIRAYLNGEMIGQETAPFTEMGGYTEDLSLGATLNSAAFSVGAGEGMPAHYFDGSVDDLQVFDEALPEDEIRRLAGWAVGITEQDYGPERGFRIYPNPCRDHINIFFSTEDRQAVELTLYNLEGRILTRRKELRNDSYHLSTGQLPSGMYILEIKTDDAFYMDKFNIIH